MIDADGMGKRARLLSWAGTALVAGCYLGFLILAAFAPKLIATPVLGNIPLSFPLGAGVIIVSIGATAAYAVLIERGGER